MYEVKSATTKITATSRIAIKIRDNYYTVEFSEERAVPNIPEVVLEEERTALFDDVNAIVDSQMEDIIKTFSAKR